MSDYDKGPALRLWKLAEKLGWEGETVFVLHCRKCDEEFREHVAGEFALKRVCPGCGKAAEVKGEVASIRTNNNSEAK